MRENRLPVGASTARVALLEETGVTPQEVV